jgi:hypothetical protein
MCAVESQDELLARFLADYMHFQVDFDFQQPEKDPNLTLQNENYL